MALRTRIFSSQKSCTIRKEMLGGPGGKCEEWVGPFPSCPTRDSTALIAPDYRVGAAPGGTGKGEKTNCPPRDPLPFALFPLLQSRFYSFSAEEEWGGHFDFLSPLAKCGSSWLVGPLFLGREE